MCLIVCFCVLLVLVMFIQSHTEEYLKMANKQVLVLPVIEHVEKKIVKVTKWYNRQTYLNMKIHMNIQMKCSHTK